jgi:cytochrome c-type biogenesis protein CcsB
MRKISMSLLILLSLIWGQFSVAEGVSAQEFTMNTLPVQNGGRLKPFDTYAREALLLTYGRSKFQGEDAIKIVSTWMMVPDAWDGKEFIRVDHLGLKKALGLPEDKKFYSPNELVRNPRLSPIISELSTQRQAKEKLDPFAQAAQRLETQLMLFHELKMGGLRVMPSKDKESTTWVALGELPENQKEDFFKILKEYASTFASQNPDSGAEAALQASINNFTEQARANNPEAYPSLKKMTTEVHYNALAPFMIAWILYALASVLIFLSILFKNRYFKYSAWLSTLIAFVLHTYGFGLRVYITERPPVSNMYETVVWVAWGAMIFTSIFSFLKKKDYILLAGTMVATVAMVVADRAPLILDSSLQPLEPVLRSNLWLIIHVMTITLSYAAFFLAMGISNVALFYIIRGEKAESPVIRDFVDTCYKTLQVGVVLLAAGTILGGVWADYSWGRFWGWDPKETWALIALLGYLALLHGRLAGLVKNFGMLAGSVIAFNLVIMAWYGVNFVLGAGLHSYGFGAGGIEYVAAFVGVQFIYVFYAGLRLKL